MQYLLDTHLLLWTALASPRLPTQARTLLNDPANRFAFSAASLWEIAIKNSLGRADFNVDARRLRRGLLDSDFRELPITGEHAVSIDLLPPIHKDPFDRILIAQALAEGILLLTVNTRLARYPGPIRLLKITPIPAP